MGSCVTTAPAPATEPQQPCVFPSPAGHSLWTSTPSCGQVHGEWDRGGSCPTPTDSSMDRRTDAEGVTWISVFEVQTPLQGALGLPCWVQQQRRNFREARRLQGLRRVRRPWQGEEGQVPAWPPLYCWLEIQSPGQNLERNEFLFSRHHSKQRIRTTPTPTPTVSQYMCKGYRSCSRERNQTRPCSPSSPSSKRKQKDHRAQTLGQR